MVLNGDVRPFRLTLNFLQLSEKNADPDQTPRFAASDPGLSHLPVSLHKDQSRFYR